jgi:hypothetical protein
MQSLSDGMLNIGRTIMRKRRIAWLSSAGFLIVVLLSLFDRWEDITQNHNRGWAVAYVFASGISGMLFGAIVALIRDR